jgi:hypothetical protein
MNLTDRNINSRKKYSDIKVGDIVTVIGYVEGISDYVKSLTDLNEKHVVKKYAILIWIAAIVL